MSAAPIPPAPSIAAPDIAAPDIARRLAVILAAIGALIARAYLRNPNRVAIIVPLWNSLSRIATQFTALAAHVAAGHLPRPPRARSPRPNCGGPQASIYPTTHGWLVADLRHEAVVYANRLAALLAEPATAEFLAAVPTARRLLRPVCRMLGIPPRKPRAAPQRATPSAAPEPATPAPTPQSPPRRGPYFIGPDDCPALAGHRTRSHNTLPTSRPALPKARLNPPTPSHAHNVTI